MKKDPKKKIGNPPPSSVILAKAGIHLKNKEKKSFKNQIKYLKKEEYRRLKEVIDNFRDKVIISLLYSSGCRVSEICKMKIEDIDFEQGYIRIPALNTKSNDCRVIRAGLEVLNDIKGYLRIEKRKKGPLFNSERSPHLTDRRVRQIVHYYANKAGIQEIYGYNKFGHPLYTVTPHTLRHTHVVHALMNKVPITAVQKQVGHKNLSTTQIYCDLAPEQVKEAYDMAGFE